MAWTKEYRAEYMKKYREENREQLKANRAYAYQRSKKNSLHPSNASAQAYREAHREEANSKSKEWYLLHKDEPEFKARRNKNVRN
jgi:hypothetical protein